MSYSGLTLNHSLFSNPMRISSVIQPGAASSEGQFILKLILTFCFVMFYKLTARKSGWWIYCLFIQAETGI